MQTPQTDDSFQFPPENGATEPQHWRAEKLNSIIISKQRCITIEPVSYADRELKFYFEYIPVIFNSMRFSATDVGIPHIWGDEYGQCLFPCVCKCELTLLDHLRASSCSCLAATIMGSLSTSPTFCSGNSSSFSSGGGGRGGGNSSSGNGGFGGACSWLTWRECDSCQTENGLFNQRQPKLCPATPDNLPSSDVTQSCTLGGKLRT